MINKTRAKTAVTVAFCMSVGFLLIQYYCKVYLLSTVECMPNCFEKRNTRPTYNIVNLKAPVQQKFECLNLTIIPPTPICIYDPQEDNFISNDIKNIGAFEIGKLLNVMISLGSHKNYGLIDIGANIGEYTLAAAMNGHRVIAVEPLNENVQRIARAAQIGGTTANIILLKNAISFNHTTVKMIIRDKNIGGSFVHLGENIPYWDCKFVNCTRAEYVNTLQLDDLAPLATFKSAVLKIDIEGFERYAFKEANILFDTVDIPFVYMEWLFFQKKGLYQRCFFRSVTAIVNFFYKRHYKPYADWDINFKTQLGVKWLEWPVEIVWKKTHHIK